MWQDYETTYRGVLQDAEFLAWRELGARRKAQNIVRVCREIEANSVIEIGCGTGAVLRMLHVMNFAQDYCCIDLSSSAVRFTAESCQAFYNRAVVGRADALPFRDNTFSVAILSHVLEHLEAPVSALREASRIARFVVVEVPTEKVVSNFVRRNILGRPYPSIVGAGHVQFWSPSSIAKFLTLDAGLEILHRHLDPLGDEADPGSKGGSGARVFVKRTLRSALPISVYSRVLTTHAAFLCRKP
jgi:SAM-dependent methyltransferase